MTAVETISLDVPIVKYEKAGKRASNSWYVPQAPLSPSISEAWHPITAAPQPRQPASSNIRNGSWSPSHFLNPRSLAR